MRHMLYSHLGLLILRRHPKFPSDLTACGCALSTGIPKVFKPEGYFGIHFLFSPQLKYKFGFYAVFYNSKEVSNDLHILTF